MTDLYYQKSKEKKRKTKEKAEAMSLMRRHVGHVDVQPDKRWDSTLFQHYGTIFHVSILSLD